MSPSHKVKVPLQALAMMIESTSRKNGRENRNKITLVEMQNGSKLTLKDPSFLTKKIRTVSLIKIFLAMQEYHQNIAPRPPTQMIFPSTSYYPFPTATYDGQTLPVHDYNYGMSEINSFSCNLRPLMG